MKLHDLTQKRDTIARQMRDIHDKIGDSAWTEVTLFLVHFANAVT